MKGSYCKHHRYLTVVVDLMALRLDLDGSKTDEWSDS